MTQTVITSETPVEMARDEQIGQVKGLLDPILRKLTKNQIQMIIHAGGELQKMFNDGVAQLFPKLVVQEAIMDGKFDYTYVNLPIDNFPLTEEPIESVKEMHLNAYLTTRNAMARVNEEGKKFASPLTALRYVAKYPSRQLEYPMVVIFEIDGWFWGIFFGRRGSVLRGLDVDHFNFSRMWHHSFRFLVVDK